jgi:hypothetical protein
MTACADDLRFDAMKIGRDIEFRCPRCRVVAVRRSGHQGRCTHCGARLVAAPTPSEALVRACLYGGEAGRLQVRRVDGGKELVR